MIVSTNYGDARGFDKDGCNVWLGISFAAPPVGDLAFKYPLPPSPWNGVLDATTGSCNPIQAPDGFYIGNNSPDCLYLNIYAPKNADFSLPGGLELPTPRFQAAFERCILTKAAFFSSSKKNSKELCIRSSLHFRSDFPTDLTP